MIVVADSRSLHYLILLTCFIASTVRSWFQKLWPLNCHRVLCDNSIGVATRPRGSRT
jgi:hypothetical protein